MDVVLNRKSSGLPASYNISTVPLETAELLHAADFSELVAEVRQLKQRDIGTVSVRRQKALRIGPVLLKEVLQDAGMRVCTLGFAGGFTGSLNRTYRQSVDDTRRALEFAAELNARAVAVLPGSRGLHTWNHAHRIVREGLEDCLDDALRFRVDMLLPVNTFLGRDRDVYRPQRGLVLDWIESFESHRIRGMMMVRGRKTLRRQRDQWERCLRSGGMLRIGGRCRSIVGTQAVVKHILTQMKDVAIPVS